MGVATFFLVASATSVQTFLTVFHITTSHYLYNYPWDKLIGRFSLNNFILATIITAVALLIVETLFFIFFKIFGGNGRFKTHVGILALVNMFVFPLFLIFIPENAQFLKIPFLSTPFMLVVLTWMVILVSKSLGIVHSISKKRAVIVTILATGVTLILLIGIYGWTISGLVYGV